MNQPKHPTSFIHPGKLLACAAFLCCIHGNLHAADYAPYSVQGAEVALSLEKTETTLTTSSGKSDVTVNRLRFTAYEAPYRWIQGGLQLGYADITHLVSATGDEIHPSGQFIGVRLRYPQTAERPIGPHLLASYTYSHLEKNSDSRSMTLTLHDYHAEAGLAWRVRFLDGSIGGYLADLEGNEDYSGTSSESRSISSKDKSGLFASIGYWVDRSGKISLAIQEGSRNSFSLIFSRHY